MSSTSERFFQTTRGRIVAELRVRGSASATDLAEAFGLSPNAVRQQLVMLERDGLVAERSVRRGPTKPTLEFSLCPDAEKLFPQNYDRMLAAVLREVREQHGDDGVEAIFDGISRRAIEKTQRHMTATQPEGQVEQLTRVLRQGGVMADYSLIDGGFAVHEHNCPYLSVAKENPEVCGVIHRVFDETFEGTHEQTESLAQGGRECRFELRHPNI
ncbi:MAG: helix-turn-helix transcriptional regulator [Vulcanimicrobiaceae bacterium]